MKVYVKPIIEFIELKPEERLACVSGGSSGCCTKSGSSQQSSNFFHQWYYSGFWGFFQPRNRR